MTGTDIQVILPEIVLAVFAMVALLVGVFTTRDRAAPAIVLTLAAVMLALAVWLGTAEGTQRAFGGSFVDDGFARFAKAVILFTAAAVMVMSLDYMKRRGILRFEYPVLITLAAVGMMVTVSAGDLIVLYMGLELQALPLYVVVALRRDSAKSTEAGLKYFILGALSSGMMLYGASLTYGYAGTTLFAGIAEAAGDQVSLGLLFGLVFMIAGFAFKVSAAPFHMWTPDVYEGAPTPVTAFVSTAPKIAGMALFARVLHDAFGGVAGDWQQIVAFLSVLSMFLGAVAAIGQSNIKRLVAYSSISHMGFALMGLAAGTTFGVEAMLLYMAIYIVMSIGLFAFIMTMERNGVPVTDIGALHMYARSEPVRALALLILLFSLAGVAAPMLGFFAKFAVLKAAVDAGMTWLAVAGVIAAVIGAYYYIRIVYFMYFGDSREPMETNSSPVLWVFLMASAAITVIGVIDMFGVETWAAAAATTLVE
jgi:NADH-quinone oxidoreductase subunit N